MKNLPVRAVGLVHDTLVLDRRAHRLANWFAELIPHGATVLDVGCGDGAISALLLAKRPDLSIEGVDVLVREQTEIPVRYFDGTRLPFADRTFDVVLFSDVLHHTTDPVVLQREAHRVTRRHVLIKDHFRQGVAAGLRLRFMDWVGNARFGVSLPYNYWRPDQWHSAWKSIGLAPDNLMERLHLYPVPAQWLFGARLHFIALLGRTDEPI